AALVRRRFGEEVLNYIVDPFISGVYAGDPELLSSRFALKMLSELEQGHGSVLSGAIKKARTHKASHREAKKNPQGEARENGARNATHNGVPHILTFRQGMQQLPRALEAALAHPVRYQQRVTDVTFREGLWQISAGDRAHRQMLRANVLVIALQSHQLCAVTWPDGMSPELPAVQRLPHAPIATVSLGFHRAQIAHPLNGFGVLAPYKEERGILGALFNSSMFAERAPESQVQLTAFVGGARFRGKLTNARAEELSLSELNSLLGITGPPVMVSSHVWHDGIPQFNLGHEAVDASLARLEAAWPGLYFTGSYRTGVAVGDCLLHGIEVGARAGSVKPSDIHDFANLAVAGPHSL
ncbi:MAG: protoporphyrinogen oxidase, partial [Phycisphaerae bacterium]|nr:protoporphyrinogen oxidase [Gemmatimonadaceae bacterium]